MNEETFAIVICFLWPHLVEARVEIGIELCNPIINPLKGGKSYNNYYYTYIT